MYVLIQSIQNIFYASTYTFFNIKFNGQMNSSSVSIVADKLEFNYIYWFAISTLTAGVGAAKHEQWL